MDEKLMDLLDMALAERFQLAYAALRESDPESETLAQELMHLCQYFGHKKLIFFLST